MNLIIDVRESKIKEYLENISEKINTLGINVSYQNLNLGDIILKVGNLELIIERKTIYDLFSSIQDGRYKEQKYRLLKNYDKSQIVYLIEDVSNLSKIKYLRNFTSVTQGSIVNTIFRDNIKVVRSFNLEESVAYILNMLKKMKNNPEFFVNKTSESNQINEINKPITTSDYVDNFKLKKSSEMTPTNCALVQLSVIPGLSINMAKVIINRYGSLFKLMDAYQQIPVENLEAREQMLMNLELEIKNNKKRKLGKILSQRIYQYLQC